MLHYAKYLYCQIIQKGNKYLDEVRMNGLTLIVEMLDI